MNTFKDVEKDEEEPKRFWRSSMDPALKDVKKDDEEPKPALKDDKKTVIHGDEVIFKGRLGVISVTLISVEDDEDILKFFHTNKEGVTVTVIKCA
jgi:hypothetical protein